MQHTVCTDLLLDLLENTQEQQKEEAMVDSFANNATVLKDTTQFTTDAAQQHLFSSSQHAVGVSDTSATQTFESSERQQESQPHLQSTQELEIVPPTDQQQQLAQSISQEPVHSEQIMHQ